MTITGITSRAATRMGTSKRRAIRSLRSSMLVEFDGGDGSPTVWKH